MVPVLAAELTDYIIDFLWDDPAALLSCAIVCRGWNVASRFHIYRTLRIHSFEKCRRTLWEQDSDPSTFPYRFATALILVEEQAHDNFVSDALIGLPKMIPAIRNLVVQAYSGHSIPDFAVKYGLPCMDNLHRLELQRCSFPSLGHFINCICAIPSLRELILGEVYAPEMLPLDIATVNKIRLSTLMVDVLSSHLGYDLLPWICMTPHVSLLQHLSFDLPGLRFGHWGLLQRVAGRYLLSLSVEMKASKKDGEHLDVLKGFALVHNARRERSSSKTSEGELPRGTGSCLRELRLYSAAVEQHDWKAIGDILTEDYFRNLEHVMLCFQTSGKSANQGGPELRKPKWLQDTSLQPELAEMVFGLRARGVTVDFWLLDKPSFLQVRRSTKLQRVSDCFKQPMHPAPHHCFLRSVLA